MWDKRRKLFSLVGFLWSSPIHSFMSPSWRNCPSALLRLKGAPAWKHGQHGQHQQITTSSRMETRRNMLTSISTTASIIDNSSSMQHRALARTIHFLLANTMYICRRSNIRNMSKRKLLRIPLTREDGVELPLYITNILAWQFFVNFVFPLLELISRVFGYVSFYYFYPNAHGFGIIFEPLSAQSFSMSKRSKSQIRCDWHRFNFNIGPVGRDGWRHPPSVERNLPHFDIPKKGWKHWPWRQKCKVDRDPNGS